MLAKALRGVYNGTMKILFKTIVLACLFALPLSAQENEKSTGDSGAQSAQEADQAKELFVFLDEHFPGMKAELDGILKKEGKVAYDAVFEDQIAILKHYNLMLRSFSKGHAMLVIEQNKMYKELQVLLDRYEQLDPDDPARVQARANAEPVLAKSNTFGGVWAEHTVAMLKKRGREKDAGQIAALEKKIEKMNALRAQPKKIFDDWVASRAAKMKAAEGTKEKLPANWHTNPRDALAAAKESGKVIHVFCSATWCGPCQEMVKTKPSFLKRKCRRHSKAMRLFTWMATCSGFSAESIMSEHFQLRS